MSHTVDKVTANLLNTPNNIINILAVFNKTFVWKSPTLYLVFFRIGIVASCSDKYWHDCYSHVPKIPRLSDEVDRLIYFPPFFQIYIVWGELRVQNEFSLKIFSSHPQINKLLRRKYAVPLSWVGGYASNFPRIIRL